MPELQDQIGRRNTRCGAALAHRFGSALPEVQVEKIASAQLVRLNAMIDESIRHPPDVACGRDHAAVDLGVLSACVVAAFSAQRGIKGADARKDFLPEAEISTEDRRVGSSKTAGIATVVEFAEETEQLFVQPSRSLAFFEYDLDPPSQRIWALRQDDALVAGQPVRIGSLVVVYEDDVF